MDIGPVLPVSSAEAIRALSLNDAAREGRILEARVTAMISNTLARLAIEGQTLDVATPKPLPVGAMLSVRAEREGGQLRLVTQGPIRNPDTPALTASQDQALPSSLLEPVKAVLAKVHALAVEAMLADTTAPEAAPPQNQGAAASAPAQAQGRPPPGAATPMPSGPAPEGAPETPLPQTASSPQAPGSRPPASQPGPAQQGAQQAGAPPTPGQPSPPQLQAAGTPLPAATGTAEAALPQNPTVPPAAPPPAPDRPSGLPLADLPRQDGKGGILPQFPSATPREVADLGPVLAERSFAEAVQQDEGAAPAPRPADTQARPSALQPPGLPHAAGQSPGATPDTAAAPREAVADIRDARAAGAALSDLYAANASDTSPSQIRAERNVHFTIDIPLHFPGNPAPLRLEVEREDEAAGDEDGAAPRGPSWTIRFAAEAGSLGMVHAAITYAEAQIGVQLWAERSETATLFNRNAAELQDALQASDIRLEALSIAEGRPAEKPKGGTAVSPAPGDRAI